MSRIPTLWQPDLFGFAEPPRRVEAALSRRHIQLDHQIVAYTLRRGKQRRISLRIDERGLMVGAPTRASLGGVEDFIRSHAGWVLTKLAEHASRQADRQLRVHDGMDLPLLGATLPVRIVPGPHRSSWHEDHLRLEVRAGAGCAEYAQLTRRALQVRALSLFGERLAHYAQRLGLLAPPLRLSSARTRWGSCSLKSGIRINWRLIHLPLPLIDYVIAHELAHLREMNHSPRFWAVVAQLYPDWAAARNELKRRGQELPVL